MTVRMRHTRSQSNQRRSHHALKKPTLASEASGSVHMRHRMNPATGLYRGRKVVDMAAKASKTAKKSKEKANAR
jgi:ribosomal protein L32